MNKGTWVTSSYNEAYGWYDADVMMLTTRQSSGSAPRGAGAPSGITSAVGVSTTLFIS